MVPTRQEGVQTAAAAATAVNASAAAADASAAAAADVARGAVKPTAAAADYADTLFRHACRDQDCHDLLGPSLVTHCSTLMFPTSNFSFFFFFFVATED